jgi:hypothetical protein
LIKFGQNLFKQGVGHFILRAINLLFWNKEELPKQWKESVIVPVYEKGGKTDYSNYWGISLLSTTYKLLVRPKFWPLWHIFRLNAPELEKHNIIFTLESDIVVFFFLLREMSLSTVGFSSEFQGHTVVPMSHQQW